MHFFKSNKKTVMDAWFWIHMYVLFRGLCQILSETIGEAAGIPREKMYVVKMRMPTLTALFKYVNRLRVHDLRRRRHWSLPRLVVHGTYFPPEAHVRPVFTVHGETTPQDKAALQQIVDKYPGFATPLASGKTGCTWMRIVALKVHCGYHHVVAELNRLCRSQGALMVLTITNDPFVEPCVTTIGLHDGIKEDVVRVLSKISNIKFVSF
jgi:hypothetical protein